MEVWTQKAADLDAADVLAACADAFIDAPGVSAYLDGNSLGRPLAATVGRLESFVRTEWASRLIRSWDELWFELPRTLGDRIGRIALGAAGGQTVVADSTTVLLYKLVRAAAEFDRSRQHIVIDDDNFPTDRFVVEGIVAELGMSIDWIKVDREAGVSVEQVRQIVGPDTALVLLSHVAYRSGYIADAEAITHAVHDAGALMVWDLCHSVGVVPMELDAWGVDIAIGCTYKYLNGGPGSPAFAYVNQRLHASLIQPIWGWMGDSDPFLMGERYKPAAGVRRFISGTPPVLGMLAMNDMLDLIDSVTISAVRAKSVAITEFVIELYDEMLAPLGVRLVTPRASERRGSHVTLAHPTFREVTARLWQMGIIPDFRSPDGIRIGLSPLSTTFAEALRGVTAIRTALTSASAQ
ncbi:MAG: aminotransferase class V-fold PLP-dependent enzyme [Pseudolysinimonas sp.]